MAQVAAERLSHLRMGAVQTGESSMVISRQHLPYAIYYVEVTPMNIPIPPETPDPMIDDPALPVPKPEQDPPPTMPPVIPGPVGDPPPEEPPAILGEDFPE
jgi:hypothetical protein